MIHIGWFGDGFDGLYFLYYCLKINEIKTSLYTILTKNISQTYKLATREYHFHSPTQLSHRLQWEARGGLKILQVKQYFSLTVWPLITTSLVLGGGLQPVLPLATSGQKEEREKQDIHKNQSQKTFCYLARIVSLKLLKLLDSHMQQYYVHMTLVMHIHSSGIKILLV